MAYTCKVGERLYEFKSFIGVTEARELYAKCIGSQDDFETDMKERRVEFVLQLEVSMEPIGRCLTLAEMGIGYDQRIGPVIWMGKIPEGNLYSAEQLTALQAKLKQAEKDKEELVETLKEFTNDLQDPENMVTMKINGRSIKADIVLALFEVLAKYEVKK